MYVAGEFDCIVIGAGHAGCEAAHAAARMGCSVALLTQSLDSVALMPCNPAVGGPAKGHVVAEIDALGGLMGQVTDHAHLQMRMLNTGKGPAVRALRAQADKNTYQRVMKSLLENTAGLQLFQCMVKSVLAEGGRVTGVLTENETAFLAKTVIVTTGTYMCGKVIVGNSSVSSGPNSLLPSLHLTESLKALGLEIGRFKTGTPPRIHKRSINFSKMERQPGDDTRWRFSTRSTPQDKEQLPCWLTYTTPLTHDIIRSNLHRSPLYAGLIAGTGPRYCPSIEDKIVRFSDKDRHQIFLEPEGYDTDEYYVQGFSTSLPEDVQREMLRTIIGLERAEMMRPGYAIEYDYVVPTQLRATLETRQCAGLYTAGQVNGSSGYEEAAGQGLLAGINAAAMVRGMPPFQIKRSEGYIGVLIDDLVTKGTNEPYRLMTSRAEHRLLLRLDNARSRLLPKAYAYGLVAESELSDLRREEEEVHGWVERLESWGVSPDDSVNTFLGSHGTSLLPQPSTVANLVRRPELSISTLKELVPGLDELPESVARLVEIRVKYAGYISKQQEQVDRFLRMESKAIPETMDYSSIKGLSNEAREKLSKIRPESIGQASRISGVSPADISILLVYLDNGQNRRREEKK